MIKKLFNKHAETILSGFAYTFMFAVVFYIIAIR